MKQRNLIIIVITAIMVLVLSFGIGARFSKRFLLIGRGQNMNAIIGNEPCVKGIVTKTSEQTITIQVNKGEEARKSSDVIVVSLNAENKDSMTHFYIGDEVAVYYDGAIAESYPAQINTVYAITLVSGGEEREKIETQ